MRNKKIKSKKDYHPDFRKFAQEGDKVLNNVMAELFKDRRGDSLPHMFRSNAVLSSFDKKFMFKKEPGGCIKLGGDQVEAYIYFLHINYGKEASKRYIYRNLRKLRDSIPKTVYQAQGR